MSKIELPKSYDASLVEDAIYKSWEESGFFNPDNLPGRRKEKFVISMPPPNVTGILHLGHALENSLMDVAVRYQRMKGKKALLVPGTDHAAIATQARVEDMLKKEGIKNPRQELGREKLLAKIREYAESSKKTILSQIKKMGTSCDWSRLAYTFDEQRSKAVNTLFEKMYKDGLVYRGYRVINWSVKGQSTCSDDELVYIDQKTKVWTFKYAKDFPIPIATTRPETKLGDTAVAVHPDDERYQKYIGQKFTVDVGARNPLTITIIADKNVDPAYGTGAVGVTPAHSQIDYEMYQANKDIGIIQVIGSDGRMTPAAGAAYAGLTIGEAREKFVAWLKENDLFIKEEEITNSVGTSDRFGDVVESLPMEQWFIDVNKEIPGRGKSLKDLMREAITTGHNGDKNKIINITPERFKKVYLQRIDNLYDWNISRQIWWGHRIPVWYEKNSNVKSQNSKADKEDIYIGENPPTEGEWIQDEDTLDTWFSSGSWTFSTLGWPQRTKDLKEFHPTTWMQMGYEIIFLWLVRMILLSTYALDDIPFQDVYIHGILRDKNGKKFSKSAGNGLDPLEIIGQYGTDALRLSLIKGITPGNDARFYEEKVAGARNFVNKLWNIARYILQTVDDVKIIKKEPKTRTLADEWILRDLSSAITAATQALDDYSFSSAAEKLHEFTWNDFADWYLEIAKIEGGKDEILLYVLRNLLKLWHPFCPFVTEEIWKNLHDKDLLIVEKWPTVWIDSGKKSQKINEDIECFIGVVKAIRNLRSESNIEPAKLAAVKIIAKEKKDLLASQQEIIKKLSRCESIEIIDDAQPIKDSAVAVVGGVEVHLILAGLIDIAAERQRLEKEIVQAENYIKNINLKLSNKQFIDNAPKDVVEKEQEKLAEQQSRLEKLKTQLEKLA